MNHHRKDGEETRQRILEAACQVFGEKGYRDATVADICTRAGANIAAVNYHFGSKSALYRAVWEHGAEKAGQLYPLDGGLPPSATPRQRLCAMVSALVRRRSDSRRLGYFHQIRMSEMYGSTGELDDLILAQVRANRSHARHILSDMLGPKATAQDLDRCESSVIGQCFHHSHARQLAERMNEPLPDSGTTEEEIEHITQFSLAGIEAICRILKKRGP